MKGKGGAMVAGVGIFVVIIIVIAVMMFGKSKSSEPKEKKAKPKTKVAKDLQDIKSRIKEIEKYRMREYYRSESNNGLTIAGTILEQMIDVAVAVLEQPLVNELTSKLLRNKEDANIFADYIEMFGGEVVKNIKQVPILSCKQPLKEVCKQEGNFKACRLVFDEGAEKKTSNCDAYRPETKNIEKIANGLAKFIRDTLSKETHQDKLYGPVKNVIVDNWKMYAADANFNEEQLAQLNKSINEYPDKETFWRFVKQNSGENNENGLEEIM
jgi:hypothetical protein